MSGQRIIDGLNATLAFLDGDRFAGRMMGRRADGTWGDVSAEWLAERGIPSKRPKLEVVAARTVHYVGFRDDRYWLSGIRGWNGSDIATIQRLHER